jgi:hypothetical protein
MFSVSLARVIAAMRDPTDERLSASIYKKRTRPCWFWSCGNEEICPLNPCHKILCLIQFGFSSPSSPLLYFWWISWCTVFEGVLVGQIHGRTSEEHLYQTDLVESSWAQRSKFFPLLEKTPFLEMNFRNVVDFVVFSCWCSEDILSTPLEHICKVWVQSELIWISLDLWIKFLV